MSITHFIAAVLRAITITLTRPFTSCNRRDRIIASLTKWMAAHNSPQREQNTPQCTMVFNSLNGIPGAGRGKTTGLRKQRRNDIAIAPDHANADLFYKKTNLYTQRRKKRNI